jgi:hypothetical protein
MSNRAPVRKAIAVHPLRTLYLILGLVLLIVVLRHTEPGQVATHLARLGVLGALAIIWVYFIAFIVDTASWQLTRPTARLNGSWLFRLWKVRMVGEAFNVFLSMGGEPVKVALLKKYDAIAYKEAAASLIMTKTVYLLALIAFSAVGLVLMLKGHALGPKYGLLAAVGLGALSVGVGGFFAVQRWGAASSLLRWGAKFSVGRPLAQILVHIQEVDDYFQQFYARRPQRFHAALGLAFLNWGLGAVELYLIMYFLGHPVTWAEAWIMETAVQLVRAGTFFIPGRIGANEIGLVFIVETLAGLPSLGLAAALIRRGRELLWITWGFWLGWIFSFRPTARELAAVKATASEES